MSEGLTRATDTMRERVAELARFVSLMVSILEIVRWAIPAITALLALLLGTFFN
ncbi:hypothetical protein ACFW95_37210 [Streptomyces sp. NPDC059474]|uniref:hypothetical protein n=1 Tax=Streptomyces sp. NPDC059474 TaxID=3346846 RepID=UPI0036AAA00D